VWYRIASHLGRTVQEAQETITSTEFLEWAKFLEWKDTEEFCRQDFYLAQIAAQIQRGQVKNPSSVTIQRKLLRFTFKERPKSKEVAIQRSKAYWKALTGIESGKNPRRNHEKRPGAIRTPPMRKNSRSGKRHGQIGI